MLTKKKKKKREKDMEEKCTVSLSNQRSTKTNGHSSCGAQQHTSEWL